MQYTCASGSVARYRGTGVARVHNHQILLRLFTRRSELTGAIREPKSGLATPRTP